MFCELMLSLKRASLPFSLLLIVDASLIYNLKYASTAHLALEYRDQTFVPTLDTGSEDLGGHLSEVMKPGSSCGLTSCPD